MKTVVLLTLFALASAKPAEKMSLKAERVSDVSSFNAPAYWNADCGDRTYVGTYTLMMDWAECRDYCQYFPHAGELGHSFTFADILVTTGLEDKEGEMVSTFGTLENPSPLMTLLAI